MPEPDPNDRFKCHVDGQVIRALIIVTLENAVGMGLFSGLIHKGLGGLMSGIFGSKKEVGSGGSKQDNGINGSTVGEDRGNGDKGNNIVPMLNVTNNEDR
jgi:hypothetical protein